MLRLNEIPFPDSARRSYRHLRGLYREVRATKNRILNLIDCPVVVLLYHRVAELSADPEMIAVTPDNFRRHMEFIKQHLPILRLEDAWDNLQQPSVVITFDDGYADNVLQALPILEAVGVPATFFVSTGDIDTDRIFWWHHLEALLIRDGSFPSHFELRDSRFGRSWQTSSQDQRNSLYASLSMLMRRLDSRQRESWLKQLEKWAGFSMKTDDSHRLMTREELQRLAESHWATIGAHSVSHSALSFLSRDQQREEIFSSKLTLEEITGKQISTFSYPFGRKNEYNRTSIQLCRSAGFTRAAANFPGQIHRWTDPLQLPRHLVRNWDLETFTAELKGFWTR